MSGKGSIVDQFSGFGQLKPEETELLQSLELNPKAYPAGSVLCEAGSSAKQFFTLIDGWAGVIRYMADGRRQVLDIYLPGQIMRLREIGSDQAQSDLVALTDVLACPFPRHRLSKLIAASPRLAEILLMTLGSEQAVLNQRITIIARRPALERLAHFLLELAMRLGNDIHEYPLPLNQEMIGDVLGLSSVHVSRTFSRLRKAGLLEFDSGTLRIMNMPALRELSGFTGDYLAKPRRGQLDRGSTPDEEEDHGQD